MSGDIDSAIAKIKRAEAQIEELADRVERYSRSCVCEIVSTIDEERDEEIWRFQPVGSIPSEIPVVIGEVLHNLRSPLDNIVCAVARMHKGNDSDTYFPFGEDAAAFEKALAGKTKKLPQVACNMIRDAMPYGGGNELLWLVHHMNVSDKHRRVVPIGARSTTNVVGHLEVHDGLALHLGSRSGQHLYAEEPRPSAEEISRMTNPMGLYTCAPGTAISFGTGSSNAEESLVFLVTTPGAKVKTDMRPILDLAFAGAEHFGIEPAVSILTKMRIEVARVAAKFRATFFR